MPTQATVDRHKRRWEEAENALRRATRERAELAEQLEHTNANLNAAIAARDAAQAVDPEALLVADLEAAIVAFGDRQRAAAERVTNGAMYANAGWDAPARREPYRPATETPLGRALLHVAQRHGEAIEATMVYPEPDTRQQLVSVPRHLAEQLERMPSEAFR